MKIHYQCSNCGKRFQTNLFLAYPMECILAVVEQWVTHFTVRIA